ncbi:hypothetical protein FA13DRAFT_1733148 [Coprinellus micaceus]|uniref:Fungal-type protein kinase domain-containing protein n=1 Tax=Coprinellus micaceus TaxID=71717 RepID=A0A4Y7T977_COPMI|nr:hypothetical protein FA13DRAFT_1733148 [Coprinellus micaceus]
MALTTMIVSCVPWSRTATRTFGRRNSLRNSSRSGYTAGNVTIKSTKSPISCIKTLTRSIFISRLADGTANGLIIDWDMASMQKSGRSDNPASANHRTGTLPFMAIDLLYARTWGHLYRYDLESCVYILVWGMVHYDLKVGQRVTKVHEARTSLARDQIHDAVQPKFAPFWEKYVEPLLELLSKLQCQVQRAKEKA